MKINRRSGKTSIQKVVFNKMSPNETLFLESTNKIQKTTVNHSSFIEFQIIDFPVFILTHYSGPYGLC
jgi:Ras-related GTP-binding protein C/D